MMLHSDCAARVAIEARAIVFLATPIVAAYSPRGPLAGGNAAALFLLKNHSLSALGLLATTGLALTLPTPGALYPRGLDTVV